VTIKNRFLKIDFTIICSPSDHTMLSSETVFCILHILVFFPKYLPVFKTGLCACVRAHNIQGVLIYKVSDESYMIWRGIIVKLILKKIDFICVYI